MNTSRRSLKAAGLLALVSRAAAQVASVCPSTNVCFKLNIPESTASSGSGDIFFQLSAPSDYEYVALGQGSRMAGANMFVVYTSQDGNNVTLSPRTASGYSMPQFNSDAQVTLLEGSGVSNGLMVANVRCSNCDSWSGGTADFTAGNGNWIYATQSSGGPKDTDDQSASIDQHNDHNSFQWNYANAKGGDSVNPLVSAAPAGSGSGTASPTSCVPRPATAAGTGSGASATPTDDDSLRPTSWSSALGPSPTARPTGGWGYHGDDHDSTKRSEKRQDVTYCDEVTNVGLTIISPGKSTKDKMLIAHAVLACLAFAVFFPAGAIAIRLASFPGVIWLHAAFQIWAYIVFIIAFGLGVYVARQDGYLQEYHPIIGMVIFACLFFQPIFGWLHHSNFKKYGRRTVWSYIHLWFGRLLITLGIINGGLGFLLKNNTGGAMIAYSVVAGVFWLAWVTAAVIGERRRANRPVEGHSPKYTESREPSEQGETRKIPHPPQGHYAPK